MSFREMSDAIRLHHQSHHGHDGHGHGGHGASGASWLHSPQYSAIDTGDNSAGDGGNGFFSGAEVDAPVAMFNPSNTAFAGAHGTANAHQSNMVEIDQHATQIAGVGGNGGNDNAAIGGNVSVLAHASGSGNSSLDSGLLHTGANEAGNGGDGYFYGGIIHASLAIYEPINITITTGYDSSALANQTNNVTFDQSAVQMAGIGGNGGNGNIASGGTAGIASSGSGVIATGDNSAGNGGDGHFSGMLLDAPIVIYHPINIALAGFGGTAQASQSNTVEIDQSAIQIAGVGGNGGSGNVAVGGDVSALGYGFGSGGGGNHGELIQTGDSHAGNGGDGNFYGSLVHTSFVLYDPVNIAVAGYNSNVHVSQTNNVDLNQSSYQVAGVGGNGGNGNVAIGGNGSIASAGFWGGSDAIATGANGAGNGGSGHASGTLIDVSIAIYAPINIAIAGPHSTAEADQINNVHFDQSAVQIAGIGGDGGHGNVALGGDFAMHLLSDLHLTV
jgi:hypothetical protein